jgi:hypothetical protein
MIERHLAELETMLTIPARRRRRALAEARDHLLCAAEHWREQGLDNAAAEAAAVRDHGEPALIARRYAEDLAHGAAQLATVVGLAAVIAYAALCGIATQLSGVHSSGGADAIAWFSVQIALTCAALSTLRALRHRTDAAVPAGKLRFVNRGWAVALGAVAVSVAATLSDGYSDGVDGSLRRTLLLVAAAATALATACALAVLLASARRTAELARHADEPVTEDALDDLRAVVVAVADRVVGPARRERVEALTARCGRHPALRAVSLRTHPWRFGALVGLAAGAVVAGVHLVGEGPASDGLLTTLLVGGVLVAIEAAAIVACFALLGSFLGIRGGYRSTRSA